jgi:hypothetical protein
MVRHKARWLLVQFEFEKNSKDSFPSKKEVSLMIRQSISSCFGLSADGAAMETQGTTSSWKHSIFFLSLRSHLVIY